MSAHLKKNSEPKIAEKFIKNNKTFFPNETDRIVNKEKKNEIKKSETKTTKLKNLPKAVDKDFEKKEKLTDDGEKIKKNVIEKNQTKKRRPKKTKKI